MTEIALYPHQKECVELLKNNRQFGVFHACGTGKTRAVLQAIKTQDKQAIVVVPESGKCTWEEENKLYGCDLDLYNYTSFHKLTNKDVRGKILVYDECHALTHIDSKRSKQAQALTDYFAMYLLSGTIIADKPVDLFSILTLLGLREQTDKEWYRFRSKYAIMKNKMIGWMRTKTGRRMPRYVKEIVGWKNLDALRLELENKASFLKLEQIKDMPPVTFVPIYYNLTQEEFSEYRHISGEHIMTRLQLCSGFSLKRVKSIVDEIEGKVVIFSTFINTVKSLVNELGGVELIGETEDRKEAYETFKTSDKNILVTTYQTGGESLNLQMANYEILVDFPQWLLQIRQSLSRIYRTGQEKPCFYYILIPRNTVIEKTFEKLKGKFKVVTEVLEEENIDIMALMSKMSKI